MSAHPASTPTRTGPAGAGLWREGMLVCVAAVWVLGSELIWSSPEYRERHLLVSGLLCLPFVRSVLWPRLRATGWPGLLLGVGLLVMHLATWIGGVRHGQDAAEAARMSLQSLVALTGLATFTVVLLDARWRRPAKWLALTALGVALAGSLIGYFIFIERFIPLGDNAIHFDTLRLALIWPTRMLTASLGQLSWDHTNYAAYYFALALIMMLEYLGAVPAARRPWLWVVCGLLAGAVYLTGSRTGWVMALLPLPLILIRRDHRFVLLALTVMGLGICAGRAGLRYKVHYLPEDIVRHAALRKTEPGATHTTKLISRGSAGRSAGYVHLWHELDGARMCGRGLKAVGRPVLYLNQEHSTYMATFRGGGLIACAGHLLVLASSAAAALACLRRGQRWPAVLLVTAAGGLCFDRSSVVALTGNYEFIAHWVAVLAPLLSAAAGVQALGREKLYTHVLNKPGFSVRSPLDP